MSDGTLWNSSGTVIYTIDLVGNGRSQQGEDLKDSDIPLPLGTQWMCIGKFKTEKCAHQEISLILLNLLLDCGRPRKYSFEL